MSIYEVCESIKTILDTGFVLDHETGEIVEGAGMEKILADLQLEKTAKIEGLACYAKNLLAEAAELKVEEASLKNRRQQKEKKAESIKGFLGRLMAAYGDKKIETTRAVVQVRTAQAVEIVDPKEFLNYAKFQDESLVRIKSPEPNKEEIKRRLKAGEDVPGAVLVDRDSVSIK